MIEKGLGFKCDETFTEETALSLIKKSLDANLAYKFVLVDLDDPTMLLGRFMQAITNLMANGIKIDVYACASTDSQRVVKICKELNVTLILKPITLDKVKHFTDLYKAQGGLL